METPVKQNGCPEKLEKLLYGETDRAMMARIPALCGAADALNTGNTKIAAQLLREQADSTDSRIQIIAWNELAKLGIFPEEARQDELLGLLIEVGYAQGSKLLAVYVDHSARYFSFRKPGVVWMPAAADPINDLIDQLFADGRDAVRALSLLREPRHEPPEDGYVRLNFLTPLGPHTAFALYQDLMQDPLCQRIIEQAVQISRRLRQETET